MAVTNVKDAAPRLHFESTPEWHHWLAANHRQNQGTWLVSWKPSTSRPAIPYEEAVEEALCHGWIDSTYRSLDDERGMLWYSPRRKGSLWAASNKERVRRLEAKGRMTEAGHAAIDSAKADGSWSLLEPVEALIVPDDLGSALDGRPYARDHWEALLPTSRRAYLLWIYTARREETRARRVSETADLVARAIRFEQR
jgi:uncharacterized protein YdeI (YjbR/CyaY-like superfamily)